MQGTAHSNEEEKTTEFHQLNYELEMQELADILQEFQELLNDPKALPPTRSFDHEIPLVSGAKPVNCKPYRYSYDQKNTIEKMVDEMLVTGIITHSSSPFASTVLLVPKKDNTWRFCIDYKALNEI